MSTAVAQPAFTFTSHVAGRNATVRVYPTHIEWTAPRRFRWLLAVCTVGLTLLIPPLWFKGGMSDTIPMRAVSSVTTKRGALNTVLTIVSSGGAIAANISHNEAERVKSFILGRLV